MQLAETLDSTQLEHSSATAHAPLQTAVGGCFVALSQFTVARKTDQVKRAFQQRPHRVDDATGFVRMEVLSPCDAPDEIWLITYWQDESSYRTWHRSHLYQESHVGIPKGLRLVPKSVSMRFFDHVAS
jgi:heme-degrading monooxygenase HmoA